MSAGLAPRDHPRLRGECLPEGFGADSPSLTEPHNLSRPDLTEDDKAIIVELLRETIERDRFPWSPRVNRLRSIQAKLRVSSTSAMRYPAPKPWGPEHCVEKRRR